MLSFNFNLLSARKLATQINCCLIFLSNLCFIQDLASWTTIEKGEVEHGLYHLLQGWVSPTDLVSNFTQSFHQPPSFSASVINPAISFDLWHYRLGHISDSRLKHIDDDIVFSNVNSKDNTPCCICPLAKQHRLPFSHSNHHSSAIFDLVHCDLWGPCSVVAHDGSRFSLTLVDDFSRSTWGLYAQTQIRHQNLPLIFCQLVSTQFNSKVKVIRSDNGMEFHLPIFYSTYGIIHQRTCVEAPPTKWHR